MTLLRKIRALKRIWQEKIVQKKIVPSEKPLLKTSLTENTTKINFSSIEIDKEEANLKDSLKNIFVLAGTDTNSDIFKISKYAILVKFKEYYQIKKEVNVASNKEYEMELVNVGVAIIYGANFMFSPEKGLQKVEKVKMKELYRTTELRHIGEKLVILFKLLDMYNIESETYKIIKYACLGKYKATARMNKDLKNANDQDAENKLINQGLELSYDKGYVLTEHGIAEGLEYKYSVQDKINIIKDINQIFKILKEKMDIDVYIDSGTLLGAVRNGCFIPHDDDFDSAYISNESLYPNIWLESVEIMHLFNNIDGFQVKSIVPGLLELSSDFNVRFDIDLFTGWIEGSYLNTFPYTPNKIRAKQVRPLKSIDMYGEKINIPADADVLLKSNYGDNWMTPDPTWRFNWDSTWQYYVGERLRFLGKKAPTIEWIAKMLPVVCESSKISQLLNYAKSISTSDINRVFYLYESSSSDRYLSRLHNKDYNAPHLHIYDSIDIENNFTDSLGKDTIIIFFFTQTKAKTNAYLSSFSKKISNKIILIFNDYLTNDAEDNSPQHSSFVKFVEANPEYSMRYVGRTSRSQVMIILK